MLPGISGILAAGQEYIGVHLQNATYSSMSDVPTVGFRLWSTGLAEGYRTDPYDGNVSLGSYNWLLAGAASLYQCRATLTSGVCESGTLGTWLSMASTNIWSNTRTSGGTDSGTLTIEIRLAATGVVLASASVTISAINI